MDARTEFSPGYCQPVSALPRDTANRSVRVSLYVNLPVIRRDLNTLLVVSFEHENKSYGYTYFTLNDPAFIPGRWHRVNLVAPVPEFLSEKDLLKVYAWNPAKELFYLDDIKVELISSGIRKSGNQEKVVFLYQQKMKRLIFPERK